jgi:hypothetical protein
VDLRLHFALRGPSEQAIRLVRIAGLLLPMVLVVQPALHAQGVSTGSITGFVRSANGADVDDARVEVLNRASGYTVRTTTRDGRYHAFGLEVGGPYVVTARRLGFAPVGRDSIYIALGVPVSVDLVLEPTARTLDGVRVVEREGSPYRSASGTSAAISDSLLHRLPTLNRDMYDFVRLVPQVSSRFAGLSAGGGVRLNSYLIDGVSDRQLGSNSVMGGARGGKAMPIDALKEYQVLLSPYDARFGDFAGLLVNAVTKSGTNELRGSVFGYLRNEQLARGTDFLRGSSFERGQFGFTLGGPIIRNRVHFFVAPELQHHAEPAAGPYIGQSADASSPLPVSVTDVERFASLLQARGIDAGHGRRVTSENPVNAFFGRIDVSLPEWNSRLAIRHTYSDVELTQFARSTSNQFALSSSSFAIQFTKRSTALQLFTQPASRVFNELLIAYSEIPNGAANYVNAPTIQVSVPNVSGGPAFLVAGPPDMGQGTRITNESLELANHLSFRVSERHALSVGARAEWLHYYGDRVPGSFGRWTFSSLDSLARGTASAFRLVRDFGGASKRLDGVQVGAYLNDEWQPAERLTVSLGLRADVLSIRSRPEYTQAIESTFGRRTSDFPAARVHWSPRLGVSWEPGPDGLTRIRGGAGLFAGRPPLGWLRSPLRQYGTGIRTLVCGGAPIGPAVVPEFNPDPSFQPNACANGRPYSGGVVDLVDSRLRMGEAVRTSVAVDRHLPWNVVATAEASYTKNRSDFMLVNMNLRGPQGVDRNGRVMYGTLGTTGAKPALVDTFPEVIDLRNQSRNSSWSITGQLTKTFSDRIEARFGYTRSVTRDVQSLVQNTAGNPAMESWAGARALSGRHDDLTAGISSFDVPHRVVLGATYVAPWKRWTTDASVYYGGESGVRFTYLDSSATMGMGDLNADGTSANDPIYVPRDAADANEILFAGSPEQVVLQQAAFERFIEGSRCLRRQRGRIVERNSCTAPWVHSAHVSIRQGLPPLGDHRLTLQLDLFNVLNLLNSGWGLARIPTVNVLEHVSQTAGAPNESRSVFRFNPTRQRYNTANVESAYQFQLAARYSF